MDNVTPKILYVYKCVLYMVEKMTEWLKMACTVQHPVLVMVIHLEKKMMSIVIIENGEHKFCCWIWILICMRLKIERSETWAWAMTMGRVAGPAFWHECWLWLFIKLDYIHKYIIQCSLQKWHVRKMLCISISGISKNLMVGHVFSLFGSCKWISIEWDLNMRCDVVTMSTLLL